MLKDAICVDLGIVLRQSKEGACRKAKLLPLTLAFRIAKQDSNFQNRCGCAHPQAGAKRNEPYTLFPELSQRLIL